MWGVPLARAQQFQHCIIEEGITYKSFVCRDVTARWNSTCLMLETALMFKQAFVRLQDDDIAFVTELDCWIPTSDDWNSAFMLFLFLKNFYEATKRMSGSLYVTNNHYCHKVVSMFCTLIECERDSNPCLWSITRKMRLKFDKYYVCGRKSMIVLIVVVQYCYQRIGDDSDRAT